MIKKLLIVLAMIIPIAGCSRGDGWNQTKLRQAIVEEMKTTEIVRYPDNDYKFIVRTPDGAVWFVEMMGTKAEITAKALLFPAK